MLSMVIQVAQNSFEKEIGVNTLTKQPEGCVER